MKRRLICHPDQTAPTLDIGTQVTVVGSDVFRLEFVTVGDVGCIRLPERSLAQRRDELWRSTCFEAFVLTETGYVEFNFGPSTAFASYRFEGYRSGMQPAVDLPSPEIFFECHEERLRLVAFLDGRRLLAEATGPMALSAVIEEIDGTKSYWALAHAPGPPDFHNPACFTATLPPPAQP